MYPPPPPPPHPPSHGPALILIPASLFLTVNLKIGPRHQNISKIPNHLTAESAIYISQCLDFLCHVYCFDGKLFCVPMWKKYTIDHAMDCKKGGFIHQLRDKTRDLIAKMMDDVLCEDPWPTVDTAGYVAL